MNHEVAVTGLGVVAPHGDEPGALFQALLQGRSAIQPVFPDLPKPAAAATAAFDETRWFTKLQLAGVDRVSQLAVAAADLAMRDAGLAVSDADPERVGVFSGCGMGGAAALEAAYRGNGRVSPLTIPAFMPNAPAAHVAMRQGVQGPVLTYSVACASSSVAIAEAAKAVQRGEVDFAIAGGSEALIVPGVVVAWQAMQTLASFQPGEAAGAVRPFATDRSGFVLGEGAAFLILESAERARARGARSYATLAGWGLSSDATHLTKPDSPGQARALRAALRTAGLQPRDVGYCNAHGTATRIGDVVERNALAEVWGDDLDALRVSSTKALHGHMLGAAGAIEALVTVLALNQRQLPPNANCREIDPDCQLNLVTQDDAAAPSLEAAVSNSFAFGGTNSVLLFKRA
ncbi:beta-ketoacyl-[acyl-carrier-protein] synthase family protein [Variovorax sp. NFACC27]|uniref:Nodulation protein E n=1 Tax=Variovorax gossypii TaxID=1679495 RepID=A0A3S0HBL6_9BURK|nr:MULTISPECIES: beta-ketoacyl-[acyl-carrier-protein] synthase family protein [Variovorax]MDP9603668.1 3-oxoacyl-[acyl-carrier-protein] synthase II [Variovorax paradoxus]SEF28674.1 3-oxoacyl-[acyl-carrier-protein] synthase II [Variovorax sp. NFACC28]SEG79046.1 3-oxoacyl-[acyl-carrier-protein] synthase II [Variovorax sp. NFACC29]SFC93757.1 3-oxoacyl-[acyl-carrier-protein] synthase II [Variovorax sp. NFACC26]SFG07378.1 3-oxoacyl-[acyl-carrier-protein] synthase II [Variovorax sp. NFACC27]